MKIEIYPVTIETYMTWEKENDVKSLITKMLESPINVTISYVDDFPNYKFEEFVSMV